jgi:hypothetical protein
MFFGEEAVYRRADNMRFVIYFEQFHRSVIAVGDDQGFCVQDEDTVQGGIEDGIHELFFFQDGIFVVPVNPDDGIGKESSQQQREDEVAFIQTVEHVGDMDLIVVFLRALIIAKKEGNHGNEIGGGQLRVFPSEADDKGHDQEIGKIKQVFPGPDPFHIIHDDEVQVQVKHGHHPGKPVFTPQVEVIGYDKDIGSTQVNQCADIKTKAEIGNDAYEMRDKDQQDELVETNRLLSLGRGIFVPDPGIDNVLIKGPAQRDNRVAQR